MDLVQFAAGKTLSSSAVFLLVTVLMLAAARRVSTSIVLFGLQSAIITAQVMATAYKISEKIKQMGRQRGWRKNN